VNRRATQKKTPMNDRISIDLDKQNALLRQSQPDSLTWNVQNESIPRFGRSSRFDNSIYNIVQTTNVGTVLTSSAALPIFGSLYFTAAAHLTQFTALSSVFDQYRIMEIEVWLQPTAASGSTLGSSTASFTSVIDYDDANTPLSMAALYNYENVIVGNTANGHYRKFKPHIAMAAFSGTFGGYVNSADQWIDVASSGVQYYGMKFGIDTAPTSVFINAYIRVWAQFRNVF